MNRRDREIRPLLRAHAARRAHPRVECDASYTSAALALVFAYLTFVGTGLWCTRVPPVRRIGIDGLCFEVVRRALHTEVVYLMGTPPTEYRLLLRFEEEQDLAVQLYSDAAFWSSTLDCDGDRCADVMMMSRQDERVRVVGDFRLSPRAARTDVERALGLDGTFTVGGSQGRSVGYRVGSHRICPVRVDCDEMPLVDKETTPFDRLDVVWDNGAVYTRPDDMVHGRWSDTIVHRSGCKVPSRVFPTELMAPDLLFSSSMDRMLTDTTFARMYEVYELGTGECAQGTMERDESIGQRTGKLIADTCTAHPLCRSEPSVSYTHATTSELLVIRTNRSACIGIRDDPSLYELTHVSPTQHSMNLAWLRLFLMLFAAAIVYVRSSDVNVKVDAIFVRCIQAIGQGHVTNAQSITVERGVLAFVAAITRLVIPLFRWRILHADGLHRALTMELVAGSASILHWALLHVDCSARRFKIFVFETVPLFLGGSSAVIDVSCTTMLAFTNAPLRGGTSTFDAVVRMLTTVLLSLVCISRCLFSISCAGLVLGVHTRWPTGDLILMLTAGIFWLIQTVSIAVSICDLYATPSAWSFARSTHIQVSLVATTIFCVFSLLAAPTITRTATRICEHVDEKISPPKPAM